MELGNPGRYLNESSPIGSERNVPERTTAFRWRTGNEISVEPKTLLLVCYIDEQKIPKHLGGIFNLRNFQLFFYSKWV